MTTETSVELISASLAPALLISAVGLLLAGLQAKYSVLVGVIRELCGEFAQLSNKDKEAGAAGIRASVIPSQIKSLVRRARLVRNAIVSLYLGVIMVILSSFALAASAWGVLLAGWAVATLFGGGLIAVVVGVTFAFREAMLCYQIIQLEFSQLRMRDE